MQQFVVLTLTAGSAFIMWVGERITEKGVGNGISIVLVINIISRVPSDMTTLYEQFVKGKEHRICSACSFDYSCDYSGACCSGSYPAGRREKDCSTVFSENAGKKDLWRTVYPYSS